MSKKKILPCIEPLEARIAPAAAVALPTIKDAELAYDSNPQGDTHFVHAVTGTPILVKAGQILTTGNGARSGSYLMFVQKGQMLVFTTDLNNNGQVDYNEITGIAAGDGLRLTSFVDIHGDIVTNLDADGTLTDSDNNASNNTVATKGDGLILKNSRIESITMRGLKITDLTDQNGDKTVDQTDIISRLSLSSYSIFGQTLAGRGFGVLGDATSGLFVDDSGSADQLAAFNGNGAYYFVPFKPSIGAIRTGTAANGEYFSFGYSRDKDIQGDLSTFTPPTGQDGGDIVNVSSTNVFNISGLYAGSGGQGARGGNIQNVTLNGDNASGYDLVAGNGGRGASGGGGGSILNFTDIGSVTGKVLLKTGDGGSATNNIGGNGGILGLAGVTVTNADGSTQTVNLNINAGLTIDLGNGGAGFRSGGNGASLSNSVLRAPDGTVVYGQSVVATTHDGAHDPTTGKLLNTGSVIGRTNAFDLNGDGFNDLVYTSSEPEQLAVEFGDGLGGFLPAIYLDSSFAPTTKLFLDGPQQAQALAVGDFNGDGHMDIAVGSTFSGNFAGITVYLARFEDGNRDGLTSSEDVFKGIDPNGFNHTGYNDFLGFSTGRTSPLPSLNSGDPLAVDVLPFYEYIRSSNPITDMAVGDFDGDGYTDIAVTATYLLGSGTFPPVIHERQVLLMLSPDIENGLPTGHFFADVGTKQQNGRPPQGIVPFVDLGQGGNSRIEATALSNSFGYDVVVETQVASTFAMRDITDSRTQNALQIFDFSQKSPFGPFVSTLANGGVDTNRTVGQVAMTNATNRDFAIGDFNGDGMADYAIITEAPTNFLIAIQGDGFGGGTILTKNPNTNDQQGHFYAAPHNLEAIRAAASLNGISVGVGILDTATLAPRVETVVFSGLNAPSNGNPGTQTTGTIPVASRNGDDSVIAFDSYVAGPGILGGGPAQYFGVASPNKSAALGRELLIVGQGAITGLLSGFDLLSSSFVDLSAGDGGLGIIGHGGNGGNLGNGKLTTSTATDGSAQLKGSFDFTFPNTLAFEGVFLTGGHGGDGFSSGGTGGNISGVAIRADNVHTGEVQLTGGAGGTGKAGAGGAGGSLSSNTLERAFIQHAGNGGDGLSGGSGGSVLGHGILGFADNNAIEMQIFAGDGGKGPRRGGNGGSILNYHNSFINPTDLLDGALQLVAGDGGSSVSGAGGNGGDVLNVNPFGNINDLAGDVNLAGGNGGDGLSGGRGGSVSGFSNKSSGTAIPGVVSFIGGNGGNASRKAGGAGGSVSQISTNSVGTHGGFLVFDDFRYTYDHIIAGSGGRSFSGTGGNGGSISFIATGASDNDFAIAAGAGGAGLIVGGNGGNINAINLDPGRGKALVIAGAGGNAGAFIDALSPQNSMGFGGRVGKGGNGGSVIGITQTGATGAHMDIIAGNGGDTVNFGRVADSKAASYVGRGGSVANITMDGTLGNTEPDISIKSYNNLAGGQTIADFVDFALRNPLNESPIDDSVGNVGVVVGGAGRLKAVFVGYDENNEPVFRTVAATRALNGTLTGIHTRGILAAVADSVDRIASIRAVRDITFNAGGSVGTDKNPTADVQYLDKIGAALRINGGSLDPAHIIPTPVVDGALIDGAMVSSSQPVDAAGNPVTLPGHVFVLT